MNVEAMKAELADKRRVVAELSKEVGTLIDQIAEEEQKPEWFKHIFVDLPEEFLCGVERQVMILSFLDYVGEIFESPSGFMISGEGGRPMDVCAKFAAMYILGYVDAASRE